MLCGSDLCDVNVMCTLVGSESKQHTDKAKYLEIPYNCTASFLLMYIIVVHNVGELNSQ